MARPGWYNDNANRAFPFLAESAGLHIQSGSTAILMNQLPDDIIVDVGFTPGVLSGFSADTDVIYLSAIRRVSDTIYFDFKSNASELHGVTLTFARDISDDDYLTEFAEASNSVALSCSESDGCCFELLSGYLTTFNVAHLDDFLADGESISHVEGSYPFSATVETALIQNLSNSFVLTTGLSNANRTRATSADGCDEIEWSFNNDFTHITFDACMKGDIKLEEGYNCLITQNTGDNSITIGAVVGRGAGEPCEEVPLFSGETTPVAGGHLLSGGSKCSETVRSINGKCGNLFSFSGGPGVTLTETPEENLIVINVNMSDLVICYGSQSSDISEDCGSIVDGE